MFHDVRIHRQKTAQTYLLFRPVEIGGGKGGGVCGMQPPRFLLKLTIYQLTMIMKRKKEQNNVNHFKFLENYC